MKLCHPDEFASCAQYNITKGRKIEVITLEKDKTHQVFSEQNQLVFVVDGLLNILSKKVYNKNVKAGELILVPIHRTCILTALKNARILVMQLDFNIAFCERLPLDLLLEKHSKSKESSGLGLLKLHQQIVDFANIVSDHYITDDLNCSYYYDLKIREFLFLLRAYHDKKTIFNFFRPIYNSDFAFSTNIYKHLDGVKTVKNLAEKLGYSLSGFEKKFKRVFEVSPYHWMQEQKARRVYKEITCTKKTFTDIAFEYEFSSPAHFNDFCKHYFQNTPGGLRKEYQKRMFILSN